MAAATVHLGIVVEGWVHVDDVVVVDEATVQGDVGDVIGVQFSEEGRVCDEEAVGTVGGSEGTAVTQPAGGNPHDNVLV